MLNSHLHRTNIFKISFAVTKKTKRRLVRSLVFTLKRIATTMLQMQSVSRLKSSRRTTSPSLSPTPTRDSESKITIQAPTSAKHFHTKMKILFHFSRTHRKVIRDTKIY